MERRFSLARRSFSEGGNRPLSGRDELGPLGLVPKFRDVTEVTEDIPPGRRSLA
jgi:hypothetical protein